jgi:hypothetical protein
LLHAYLLNECGRSCVFAAFFGQGYFQLQAVVKPAQQNLFEHLGGHNRTKSRDRRFDPLTAGVICEAPRCL